MSHLKERKEKNCLNCNAEVNGRFCSICGQENIEPNESAWHLVTHVFNDITHFDGKFFSSLRLLITRPGFLSTEYAMGRRASYLNPVRMYIFTSAVFFLIFFSLFHFDKDMVKKDYMGKPQSVILAMDSTEYAEFSKDIAGKVKRPMTRQELINYIDSTQNHSGITLTRKYRDKEQYDSLLKSGAKKHNWLQRQLIYKEIEVNKKYNNDSGLILSSILNILFHSFPQMLFICLPLYALFLKWMYTRRKQFYYVGHAVFSIHLYIFIFIVMLALLLIRKVGGYYHAGWLNYLSGFLWIWIFYYQYKAMRNFYGQGRLKTFIKFILLSWWLTFVLGLLFFGFLIFSFFKV
ncbi:MAG: hypothetical protein JWQ27_2957 [Ferruginibacter sp.]|nr:hypothetical protein [Ferruginibacter sp.]